jgi:hypothetical protein
VPIELFRPFLQAAQAALPAKPGEALAAGEPSAAALSAGELSSLMSQLRIGTARGTPQD